MILGNSFLCKHKIGLDPSKWSLIHNSQYLADMLPAWIEDTLYTSINMNNNAHSQDNQVQSRTDVLTVKKKVDRDTNKFRSMPVFHRRAEVLRARRTLSLRQ